MADNLIFANIYIPAKGKSNHYCSIKLIEQLRGESDLVYSDPYGFRDDLDLNALREIQKHIPTLHAEFWITKEEAVNKACALFSERITEHLNGDESYRKRARETLKCLRANPHTDLRSRATIVTLSAYHCLREIVGVAPAKALEYEEIFTQEWNRTVRFLMTTNRVRAAKIKR